MTVTDDLLDSGTMTSIHSITRCVNGPHTCRGERATCLTCAELRRENPLMLPYDRGTRVDHNDHTWYFPTTLCPRCHTAAERTRDGRQCAGCHTLSYHSMTPRQKARIDGELWYSPTKPCRNCHGYHPRRVSNGACKGCTIKSDVRVMCNQCGFYADTWGGRCVACMHLTDAERMLKKLDVSIPRKEGLRIYKEYGKWEFRRKVL